MTTAEVFQHACQLGFQLEPRPGGKLAVIPGDNVPPDLVDVLKAHKAELLDWLNRSPCPGWGAVPPVDLALVTVRPHPTPQDRERVLAYLLRQTEDRPGPLAAWLVRRENDYYQGPGAKWDCGLICYAAARDAASWQLNCNECELLGFFQATEEVASRLDHRRRG